MNQNTQKKDLVEAAFGRPCSRTPAWFLRQAGRYLPEYRKIRESLDFVSLCQSPKKAAEVTLQPLKRFDLDGAIIFSDILIICTAMGQKLSFDKGHGPVLKNPVRSSEDLSALDKKDIAKKLSYVGEAISETKKGLNPGQTMIGFAGAPFTVASYMIEGGSSKDYSELKKLRFLNPSTFSGLIEAVGEGTIEYLKMQISAGADCLMLFDTWANQISPHDYENLVFPATNKIAKSLKSDHPEIPLIYYPGQGSSQLLKQKSTAFDVLAIDWRMQLKDAISSINTMELDVSVQGNLDPQFMLAPESELKEEIKRIITEGKKARGHIFNVGHGLLPHLQPEDIKKTVDLLRSL